MQLKLVIFLSFFISTQLVSANDDPCHGYEAPETLTRDKALGNCLTVCNLEKVSLSIKLVWIIFEKLGKNKRILFSHF